jgi:hypothetical protein
MTDLPVKPFFIVGHPRSGTTLLRFILSSHTRLYIPEETGFIPFLHVDPEQALTQKDVQNLLARIGKLNYLWRDVVQNPSQFYAGLPHKKLSDFLDALYQLQVAKFAALRWGDKTPLYVQYLPVINKIFPNAQFIHLIRDGRDTALSARKKWGTKSPYMDIYYLLMNWVRNVDAGQQAGQWLGHERYVEIKYEEFVANPEPQVRKVCGFLNVEFEPEMLDHTPLAHFIGQGPNEHYEVLSPIHQDSVGRWRTEMSEFDQKLAAILAGKQLKKLAYELPDSPKLTNIEKARVWGLGVKFLIYDSFRSMLYRTGILTLNRNMRKPK